MWRGDSQASKSGCEILSNRRRKWIKSSSQHTFWPCTESARWSEGEKKVTCEPLGAESLAFRFSAAARANASFHFTLTRNGHRFAAMNNLDACHKNSSYLLCLLWKFSMEMSFLAPCLDDDLSETVTSSCLMVCLHHHRKQLTWKLMK